jgi:glycosyltransferase involved in cell wall biosynthesis
MRKFRVSERHFLVRILKLLELVAVRVASNVIVATPFLNNIVTARTDASEKCTTILNLPDGKFFKAIEKKDHSLNGKFKMVYPGTLSEQHGVDIAVKAVKLVTTTAKVPIEFHIYGPLLESNTLLSLITKLNVQNSVFLHPLVPIEKLVHILASMDVGIVPKRDGVFIGEAISTKLFEYAAIGLPAVVSRTSGDSLFFDDSMVLFFEPENEQDLAQKLIELFENQELRTELAKNSKLMSNKMNWQKEKEKLFLVYHKIGLM